MVILKLKLAKGKTVDDAADTSNRNSPAEYDRRRKMVLKGLYP